MKKELSKIIEKFRNIDNLYTDVPGNHIEIIETPEKYENIVNIYKNGQLFATMPVSQFIKLKNYSNWVNKL